MTVSVLAPYKQALDALDAVVAAVPPERWDAPSMCPGWTARDVVGHLVWGQEQLRAWATGQPYDRREGAPGAPQPGPLAGDDPLGTWRAARTAGDAALTPEALGRTVTLGPLGERPVSAIVTLLVTDTLAHAWDVGHALGLDVRTPPQLIPASLAWAQDNAVRMPGFFGPELTPPDGADEQARWLAYLGRAAGAPAA